MKFLILFFHVKLNFGKKLKNQNEKILYICGLNKLKYGQKSSHCRIASKGKNY